MLPNATRRYRIASEPRGSGYSDLIDFCSSTARRCSLEEYKSREVKALFGEIARYQVAIAPLRSKTPGRNRDATVAICSYELSPFVISFLKRNVQGLYGWHRPKLPVNLQFYRDNGDLLLQSIAVLRIGALHISEAELQSVLLHSLELLAPS